MRRAVLCPAILVALCLACASGCRVLAVSTIWVSEALQPCTFKMVRVASHRSQRLKLAYDLRAIGRAMQSREGYRVVDHGFGVDVSRTFAGASYIIILTERKGTAGGTYVDYYSDPLPCATPTSTIAGNVSRMLDDLPLDAAQRCELRGYVFIEPSQKSSLLF